jgi:hypothetical protein
MSIAKFAQALTVDGHSCWLVKRLINDKNYTAQKLEKFLGSTLVSWSSYWVLLKPSILETICP